MKTTIIILLLAATFLTGCGKKEEKAPVTPVAPNINVTLKISVMQSGKLLADGAESSLPDLDTRLAILKSQNGVVWYYREGGASEMPPVAMEVMKLIVKHRLLISMSSKADFSDTVDENGVSRPRK